MRIVVCQGAVTPQVQTALFEQGGLKRPYIVATMDPRWWECASEQQLPRFLFNTKMALMLFVRTHEIVCLAAKDKDEETWGMAASMVAMGANVLDIASDY